MRSQRFVPVLTLLFVLVLLAIASGAFAQTVHHRVAGVTFAAAPERAALLRVSFLPAETGLRTARVAPDVAVRKWSRGQSAVTSAAAHHEPFKTATHIAIAGMMVSGATALSITSYAMGAGGFEEANPLLKPLADDPVALAVVKTSVQVAVGWLILHEHHKSPKAYLVAALVMCAINTADAVHDARVIRQAK